MLNFLKSVFCGATKLLERESPKYRAADWYQMVGACEFHEKRLAEAALFVRSGGDTRTLSEVISESRGMDSLGVDLEMFWRISGSPNIKKRHVSFPVFLFFETLGHDLNDRTIPLYLELFKNEARRRPDELIEARRFLPNALATLVDEAFAEKERTVLLENAQIPQRSAQRKRI